MSTNMFRTSRAQPQDDAATLERWLKRARRSQEDGPEDRVGNGKGVGNGGNMRRYLSHRRFTGVVLIFLRTYSEMMSDACTGCLRAPDPLSSPPSLLSGSSALLGVLAVSCPVVPSSRADLTVTSWPPSD
ncbi:hypothetical protein GSI_00176 [Ganoderma sinense ZZ0214-1]|uniref:Uncharacterized protein n=1 Tax=Ganoderma sinense ZZ0214-1 TaxID=1077348 RepID=A0A2G8SRU0_9APHY|nr:hypothetical protein GSI_00176 [Ganoderma sinense ZZ0214-1]